MIYLCDNDVIEKLAVFDLIDDALAALGARRSDAYVVPTLKYRIGGKARARAENRLGKSAIDRILDFLDDATEIQECSKDHDPAASITLTARESTNRTPFSFSPGS